MDQITTKAARANADVALRGYAAFNTADIATLTELLDKNATWHTPGKTSIGGLRRGHEAVFGQFGRYGGDTGGTFRAELINVTADDEGNVVGLHRNTGTRNGKKLDVMCCIAFVVKGGKIMSGAEHFFDLYAWDAFWA